MIVKEQVSLLASEFGRPVLASGVVIVQGTSQRDIHFPRGFCKRAIISSPLMWHSLGSFHLSAIHLKGVIKLLHGLDPRLKVIDKVELLVWLARLFVKGRVHTRLKDKGAREVCRIASEARHWKLVPGNIVSIGKYMSSEIRLTLSWIWWRLRESWYECSTRVNKRHGNVYVTIGREC